MSNSIKPNCLDCSHCSLSIIGINGHCIVNWCNVFNTGCSKLGGYTDYSLCNAFDLCYNPESPFCKSLNVSNIQDFTDKVLSIK